MPLVWISVDASKASSEQRQASVLVHGFGALRGQSRLHNEFWTQRFFLRVCPLPLGSCDSLAGRTPSKGFFHKCFNTSCHSSPLMTRRVNFTSAKTVTHRMAMPILKPKKISMMGIIRLRCHNHFGRQYALQNGLSFARSRSNLFYEMNPGWPKPGRGAGFPENTHTPYL